MTSAEFHKLWQKLYVQPMREFLIEHGYIKQGDE